MHRDIHCCSSCEHRKNYKDVTVFMIFTPAMSTGHEGRPSLIPSGPAPRPAAPGPPWWQPQPWRSPARSCLSESNSTEMLPHLKAICVCCVQHYRHGTLRGLPQQRRPLAEGAVREDGVVAGRQQGEVIPDILSRGQGRDAGLLGNLSVAQQRHLQPYIGWSISRGGLDRYLGRYLVR